MAVDGAAPAKGLDWHQVEKLFHAALAMPLAVRSAWLAQACGDDRELNRAVERLLESDTRCGDFLQQPALGGGFGLPAPDALAAQPEDRCIGPYRLVRLLGSGGMGYVWLARRRDEHFEKDVALKLLKRGMDTDEILARFRQERQVLARLEHPNIARLLDGGATADGRPYLVMEYIDGRPIDQFCQEQQYDTAARLHLFCEVCAAVQYAHQNLVIHRDLKPGNIAVTADGRPRLLDFGIAKVLQLEPSAQTLQVTASEVHLLTPEYASPEQIRGEPITTASDVYSLGVVLYELLTLHKPYGGEFHSRGQYERAVCEREPLRPSTAVRRAAARSLSGPAGSGRSAAAWPEGDALRLARRLRGDLDSILLTALHKNPRQRYPSAERLAGDLQRHLSGRPVAARSPTRRYRAAKFVRRHRFGVAAAAIAVLSAVVGLLVSVHAYLVAETARRTEAGLRRVAEEQTADAERQRLAAETNAYTAALAGAEASLRAQDVVGARLSLSQAPTGLRNWEWYYYAGQLDRSERCLATPAIVYGVSVSADGVLLAACCRDGQILVWNTGTWQVVYTAQGQTPHADRLAFAPRERVLAYAAENHAIKLWDLATGAERAELVGNSGPVSDICFSPDGAHLASASADGAIRVWAIPATAAQPSVTSQPEAPRAPVQTLRGHEGGVAAVAFSPDGTWLASGGADRTIRLWNSNGTAVQILRGHAGLVSGVAFSPDGRSLASSSFDGMVKLWDVASGRERLALHLHDALVSAVAFSPDGARLASSSWDKTVRVWDAVTGEPLARWLGHTDNITSVAFSPDGAQLYSGAADQTVRVWPAADHSILRSGGSAERANGFAYDPAGRWIVVVYGLGADHAGRISLWDARTAREATVLHVNRSTDARGRRHELGAIAASLDAAWVAAEAGDGSILLWSQAQLLDLLSQRATPAQAAPCARIVLRDGAADDRAVLERCATALAFSPDGLHLASAHADGSVRIWQVARQSLERKIVTGSRGAALAYAPGGKWLACALGPHGLLVINPDDGAELARLPGAPLHSLAVSTAGKWLAAGADDGRITLWDCAAWQMLRTLRGHAGVVRSLAFGPDDSRLYSGSDDRTVRVWSVPAGQQIAILHGHGYLVSGLGIRAADATLLSSSGDGTVRVWSTPRLSGLPAGDAE